MGCQSYAEALRRLETFMGGEPQTDDITLVAMRKK